MREKWRRYSDLHSADSTPFPNPLAALRPLDRDFRNLRRSLLASCTVVCPSVRDAVHRGTRDRCRGLKVVPACS